MNAIRNALIALAAVVAVASPHAAHSTIFELPDDAEHTLWAEYQSGHGLWQYTHATETWSFSTPMNGRFLSLGSAPAHTFIDDLIGSYTVTARIDHAGNVLSGAFAWVGQSAALGMDTPQIFLSGRILGALDVGNSPVSLWAAVDYTHAAISALTTAPNFAHLSFIGGPCWAPCEQIPGGWNVFGQDWQGGVIQPDIFGYHVPEPGVLGIFCLALGFTLFLPGPARTAGVARRLKALHRSAGAASIQSADR